MTELKWKQRRAARGVIGLSNKAAENLLRSSKGAAWVTSGSMLVARAKDGYVYKCLVLAEGSQRPEAPIKAAARKALGELESGEPGAATTTLRDALGVETPESTQGGHKGGTQDA